MTLARLKRIELIITIVGTILLLPGALLVGWFLGDHYSVQVWQQKNLGWKYFLHLSYGLLALILAPIILFIIRKVTQKNIAAAYTFLATLPSTIVLFGIPITYFPLFMILVWTAIASQQTAQQRGLGWPFGIHITLSILLGGVFSLILSLLVRVYVNYRYRVPPNGESSKN